jgi:hypothetical protein
MPPDERADGVAAVALECPYTDQAPQRAAPPAQRPRPKVKRKPPPRLGRVRVRVNPWAEVFYGGKSYGVTPLKRPIEVPPGTATFVLKNPQLGVNRKVTVKVTAGADVLLKADLFKK